VESPTTLAQDLEAWGIKDPINSDARGALVTYIKRATTVEDIQVRIQSIIDLQQHYLNKRVVRTRENDGREGVIEYIRPARKYSDKASRSQLANTDFEACVKWQGKRGRYFHSLDLLRVLD
jgi:hypothetical protein